MAIARVGTAGTVNSGTTTASPTFAQATTAGNLCVAWAASAGTVAMASGSGWTLVTPSVANVKIWVKPNCGASEAAPTFSGTTFTAAVLAEFSGTDTNTTGDNGASGSAGTSSPNVQNDSTGVAQPGEVLLLGGSSLVFSMAATNTTAHAYNNSATTVNPTGWNNDATSTANHFRFSYGITTSIPGGKNNSLTTTFTTTNISTGMHTLAAHEALPTSPTYPWLSMARSAPA